MATKPKKVPQYSAFAPQPQPQSMKPAPQQTAFQQQNAAIQARNNAFVQANPNLPQTKNNALNPVNSPLPAPASPMRPSQAQGGGVQAPMQPQQAMQQPIQQKGIIQRIAEQTLRPSAFLAKGLGAVSNAISPGSANPMTAEQFAGTATGKVLGTAIAGEAVAGAVLGGQAAIAAIPSAVRALIQPLSKTERALETLGAEIKAGVNVAENVVPKAATAAGEIAVNTKTASLFSRIINNAVTKGLSAATIYKVVTGVEKADTEFTAYVDDGYKAIPKLREAGLNDEAEELEQSFVELENDMSNFLNKVGVIKQSKAIKKIREFERRLSEINSELEAKKYADAKAKEAQAEADKIAAEAQQQADKEAADKLAREQRLQDIAEGRQYAESQQDEQRRYNEARLAEQRTYNEQQAQLDEQRRLEEQGIADATALESEGGSVLEFGLLKSGGGREFVDKDKAAQVYYGKPYSELTPEQRRLLNLLKENK